MFGSEQATFLNEQLEQAASKLGEHFDAVHILVAHNDGKSSVLMTSGVGDAFTRTGMLHEYMAQMAIQRNMGAMVSMARPPIDDSF
jgi:hypothetical protein